MIKWRLRRVPLVSAVFGDNMHDFIVITATITSLFFFVLTVGAR